MKSRILPDRTYAMLHIGDILSTIGGDVTVTDIKNVPAKKNAPAKRLITLSRDGHVVNIVDAWQTDNRITIRRPIPKFRPSGVTIADRVSTDSIVNAAIARQYATA